MKKYELTKEHREQLTPWANKWIKNAMSTKPMDEEEKKICVDAVYKLYSAANLPPPKHIVFVPSPAVLSFAGGFAAWIWAKSKRDATWAATGAATGAATRDATWAATWAATRAATEAATGDATWAATRAATWDATRDATWAATRDATWAATEAATEAATGDATWAATGDATRAATRDATRAATGAATWAATRAATGAATRAATEAAKNQPSTWYALNVKSMIGLAKTIFNADFMNALQCASNAYNMWNGGNQWSAWVSFLSFFRHVAKLSLPIYEKFDAYEQLAIHSGPRIMHPDFCMISDRPDILTVDNRNRPHNNTGPFCKWRDGFALYALHGVRVPSKYIDLPVDPVDLLKEENAQVRMAVIRKEGYGKFIKALNGKLIDEKPSTRGSKKPCQLWELNMPEPVGRIRLLKVTWHDTREEQETFLPVPVTKEEFKNTFGFVPTDPNNAELVRLATMRIDTGKYDIVAEM